MEFLLIGGGAREHAMALALKKNTDVELYSVMGNRNPGILRLSEKVLQVKETELERIREFAVSNKIDIAVVGPEAPLGLGISNLLDEVGIPSVGPKKELALIETDKEFCRNVMAEYSIPANLTYACFSDFEEACAYVDSYNGELVVKPVGLTGGKGVKVQGEHLKNREDVKVYIKEILERGIGGGRVVLEEKAPGEEFTVQAFVDGSNIIPMPAVQDHKRAYEGDTGHNTGGMGSYSMADGLLPFLTQEDYNFAVDVIKKTVMALKKKTGESYRGILYGQFMKGSEIKLIEFNCRFGDPETMNVLTLLESDFSELCRHIVEGGLKGAVFSELATVCKYVVPEGYGLNSSPPCEIEVDEEAIAEEGANLYYAVVNEKKGKLFTTTSRTAAVVGVADSLEEAEEIAEKAISHIKGEHIYHRRDIGTRELIEKKLRKMETFGR